MCQSISSNKYSASFGIQSNPIVGLATQRRRESTFSEARRQHVTPDLTPVTRTASALASHDHRRLRTTSPSRGCSRHPTPSSRRRRRRTRPPNPSHRRPPTTVHRRPTTSAPRRDAPAPEAQASPLTNWNFSNPVKWLAARNRLLQSHRRTRDEHALTQAANHHNIKNNNQHYHHYYSF